MVRDRGWLAGMVYVYVRSCIIIIPMGSPTKVEIQICVCRRVCVCGGGCKPCPSPPVVVVSTKAVHPQHTLGGRSPLWWTPGADGWPAVFVHMSSCVKECWDTPRGTGGGVGWGGSPSAA